MNCNSIPEFFSLNGDIFPDCVTAETDYYICDLTLARSRGVMTGHCKLLRQNKRKNIDNRLWWF